MGRLTLRNVFGRARCKKNGTKFCYETDECLYCKHNDEILERLAHYEDMEEQGRLIEQKQGTWEMVETHVWESDCMWRCSECKEELYFEYGTPLELKTYYCPRCGAKMVAEVELQE